MDGKKYKELGKISKGTYGVTYKVEFNNTIFCKKVYIIDDYKYGYTDDFIREVLILNTNITLLNLHDVFVKNVIENDIHIVIDYYDNTLSSFIKNDSFTKKHLTFIHIKNIIPSLLIQLYNVHKTGFIHSDLKLDNILEKNGEICICDWGLCEYYGYPKQKKIYQCSRYYKAPDRRLSINVDLFSLGACIYYLFTGVSVCSKENIVKDDIEKKTINLKKILDNNEFCILQNLITDDMNRPSAKKILIDFYNYIPSYIDNHFEKIEQLIDQSEINMINKCYYYDLIFSCKLNLKRVKFEKYTFNDVLNTKLYELEYLDDTFTYFYNVNVQSNKISKFNQDALFKFLKYYFLSYININTIFLSLNIFNCVQDAIDLINYRLSDIVKIIINYSCKILECSSYNIKLKNMENMDIPKIEIIIFNYFQNKNIEFVPYTFYIYYYITKIVQKYSDYYRREMQRLETLCLSLFFIVFINMININNNNLHLLSINIVIQSIYFIKNNKLNVDNDIYQYIIENSKLIPKCYITSVVEDSDLRTYLYH
jgi:serine/threonine protein kinase